VPETAEHLAEVIAVRKAARTGDAAEIEIRGLQ
jgi:hypothetical protein